MANIRKTAAVAVKYILPPCVTMDGQVTRKYPDTITPSGELDPKCNNTHVGREGG